MEIIHLMILPQLCLLGNLAKHLQLGKTRKWRYSRIYNMSEAKQNLLLPMEPFRGNRFNIIFHNASSIYYLHNHIINFLDNVKSEGRSRNLNQLLQNVQENCTINKHIIGCRTLGIFNKCSTTPMWKLLEDDNIHILDMNLHYQMLAEFIEKKRHQTLNIVKTL